MKFQGNSQADIKMLWGKFKGDLICELLSDYLRWLAENCEDETICTAADEEYSWRTDNHEHWYE